MSHSDPIFEGNEWDEVLDTLEVQIFEGYDEDSTLREGHIKHEVPREHNLREFIAQKKIEEGVQRHKKPPTHNDDITAVIYYLGKFEKCCGSFYRVIRKRLLEG
tara:strand:+ start:1156 stop:1467 length:312 start_codon:yes stop_codon:yes gene_type:complete